MAAGHGATAAKTGQRGRGRAPLLGLLLCACAAVAAPSAAWAGPAASRRSAAAAGLVAALGTAVSNPSPVRAIGTENDPDLSISLKRNKLTEEQLRQREAERAAEAERQDKLLKTFRGWFSKLANEESTTDTRVEQLTLMKNSVIAEKALPNGITREDIVKGIRNVKYNIGCTRDKPKKDPDCKAVEKGYMQLLATIDKTYDRNIITR
ncbi:unnamed protein product [Prorocentrum cordatum]|uniref:Uncharacterized protein n=1 Tax=Prorocentrum cordatum TaxID=2364126 RepID=A0ABN9XV99_9DINO|nr:unnamed protein product [Polarella glacialis]